jgi:hypothetical protein
MFITEQYINHKLVKSSGNRDFRAGMPLASRRNVKRKFTYKELTLVLGVFVAMIIAITLWFQKGDDHRSKNTLMPTAEKVIPVINSLVKSVSVRF